MKKEAILYEKLEQGSVHCFLCAHECRIAEGKFGFCGVRQNLGGTLYTYAFGDPCAMHVDPIEKKPLFHFLPGSLSFSVAIMGCNFHCGFCQNWQISQVTSRDNGPSYGGKIEIAPADIVKAALDNSCSGISYTYTEPTIFFEYALAISRLAREKKLSNVFVTNGFMTKQALTTIRPYLDAANVDLKFFKEGSYKRICAGSLKPVLDSIALMKEMGIWVEVTTLVIPGENDSDDELSGIARFIAGVDKSIPWHVSRFHPDYKYDRLRPTPEESIERACSIGRSAGLDHVYAGNVGWGGDTFCPSCKKVLIKRTGYSILENNIRAGACAFCGAVIPGRFEQ